MKWVNLGKKVIQLFHLIEKMVFYRDMLLENGFTYELSKIYYDISVSPLKLLNIYFLYTDSTFFLV